MVLPISGFLPVPLPMMIPFMGAQSLVIGKMFGEGFQYGKRKISAMPNEEFNKLTFEAMMSNARDEMQASIPTMIQAMQDMKPMVAAVVHEFTNYLSLVIQEAPKQAEQILTSVKDVTGATALNDKLVQLIIAAQNKNESQDALGDILVALGLERFGQSAGATDMTTIPLVKLTSASTISGLTIGEAREQARQKQLAYEESLREKKKSALLLSKLIPLKPQLKLGFKTKKRAGQSQIMERKKLITGISRAMKILTKVQSAKQRMDNIKHMHQLQQKLVNLIARYRFD